MARVRREHGCVEEPAGDRVGALAGVVFVCARDAYSGELTRVPRVYARKGCARAQGDLHPLRHGCGHVPPGRGRLVDPGGVGVAGGVRRVVRGGAGTGERY